MAELKKQIICIIGPTATRKTEVAISLAEQLPIEIISVDSAMVYRGMDIGTAKPDRATLVKVPHHLIDIRDPKDTYSAAHFCQDVLKLIEEIFQRDHIPLLVGGTMLYFQALLQGIAILPEANAVIRTQISEEAEKKGWATIHQQLEKVDPSAAAKIHPNDAQRIQRAMEVYLLSGKSLTEQQKNKPQIFPYETINLAFIPQNRSKLHQIIEARFLNMLDQGLIEEVKCLYQRGDLSTQLPSIRTVGYRQIWEYFSGKYQFEDMKYQAICKTRQFAKRQFTWLRHWSVDMTIIEPFENQLVSTVLNVLSKKI